MHRQEDAQIRKLLRGRARFEAGLSDLKAETLGSDGYIY